MQESLYDRFRPFKPYDVMLAVAMVFLVAVSVRASVLQQVLIIVAGLAMFGFIDAVQRLVRVPTPPGQALVLTTLNTGALTLLVSYDGAREIALAFYMLNVSYATVAFGDQIGTATAMLSVLAQLLLGAFDETRAQRGAETGLMMAVLLTLVAIITRVNRMQQEAIYDPITGLRNHRYFQARLRDELMRCERQKVPTTLLLLDLDNFKVVNDKFGHAVGDQVLRQVAQLLERHTRASDVVCRYGGEEFTIILPDTPLHAAVAVAERVRKAVEAAFGPEGPIATLSIGAACYPEHANQLDDLIEVADEAMYQAKRTGKNRVIAAATAAAQAAPAS